MKSMERRVLRGARYLDVVRPQWYNTINLDELNMERSEECIVGQLYGDYWDHLDKIKRGRIWGVRHGFETTIFQDVFHGGRADNMLRPYWEREIMIRHRDELQRRLAWQMKVRQEMITHKGRRRPVQDAPVTAKHLVS